MKESKHKKQQLKMVKGGVRLRMHVKFSREGGTSDWPLRVTNRQCPKKVTVMSFKIILFVNFASRALFTKLVILFQSKRQI